MATIAPWLVPPNYIGAMTAGAQTGLAARRQVAAEQEAGDRLRLAYDQLAASERRAHEAQLSRERMTQATMALRASQMEGLDRYRQGMLAARAEDDRLRAENMQRLAGQFETRREDTAAYRQALQSRFEDREARLADQFQRRLDYLEGRPAGREWLDPVSNALLQADVSDLKGTQREIQKMEERGVKGRGFWHPFGGNMEEYLALKSKAADLRKKVATYRESLPSAGATLRGEEKAAPARKSENEVIRMTKDGRKAVFDSVTKEFLRYADE